MPVDSKKAGDVASSKGGGVVCASTDLRCSSDPNYQLQTREMGRQRASVFGSPRGISIAQLAISSCSTTEYQRKRCIQKDVREAVGVGGGPGRLSRVPQDLSRTGPFADAPCCVACAEQSARCSRAKWLAAASPAWSFAFLPSYFTSLCPYSSMMRMARRANAS